MKYRARLLLALLATAGHAAIPATAVLAQSPETARAAIHDAEGKPIGTVALLQTPHGVLLTGNLERLPPGPHAFHVHRVGKCEPPFTSAEGHFNPGGKKHGLLAPDGPHAGDLPNIHVPASGATTIEVLAPGLSLVAGAPGYLFDTDGSSLVIHAGVDDYKSDPTGNAGARIACGIVSR